MLGQKIRELREAKGLVQRQVADAIGVDIGFVSKVESGEKQLSKVHLKKIAWMYAVSEEELHALWLADRVLKTLGEEEHRKEALTLVMNSIKQ